MTQTETATAEITLPARAYGRTDPCGGLSGRGGDATHVHVLQKPAPGPGPIPAPKRNGVVKSENTRPGSPLRTPYNPPTA